MINHLGKEVLFNKWYLVNWITNGRKIKIKKNQPQLTLKFVYEIKSKATLLVETLPDSLHQIQFKWVKNITTKSNTIKDIKDHLLKVRNV